MNKFVLVASAAFFVSACNPIEDYMGKLADLDEGVVEKVNQGLDLYCKLPENKRLRLRKHFDGRVVVNCG